MIREDQLNELRQAFNLFDSNSDTIISKQDLKTFLMSIGNPFTEEEVDQMFDEVHGDLTYMCFLTMVGERLSMTDDEKALKKAFGEFVENGKIMERDLRKWLTEKGDKMSNEEVDAFFKGCVDNGEVLWGNLISIIKHGEIITQKNKTDAI